MTSSNARRPWISGAGQKFLPILEQGMTMKDYLDPFLDVCFLFYLLSLVSILTNQYWKKGVLKRFVYLLGFIGSMKLLYFGFMAFFHEMFSSFFFAFLFSTYTFYLLEERRTLIMKLKEPENDLLQAGVARGESHQDP